VTITPVNPKHEETPLGEPHAPIRVLVADDSWHYGRALETTLGTQPGIEIVGHVLTAEEAIERAPHGVDVVLLDLDLPEMGGIAACQALTKRDTELAIVIVTALIAEEPARQALAAGARGYIVKRDWHDPERIAEAILSAARGDHLIDREVHELILSLSAGAVDPAREAGLTPRELDVIPLIADGMMNKEIATRLGVSEQTVRNHLSNIYRKLNAKNRTQMAAEARRRGLLG
jgi:DNA-binding NarL/FixJ family response regulator